MRLFRSVQALAVTTPSLDSVLGQANDANNRKIVNLTDPTSAQDADTKAARDAAILAHTGDATAAHAASAISVDSATLVGVGTDAQAVLEELDNGIADHLADTSAAHAASAIAFTPAGSLAATDVQAAIAEVSGDADLVVDTDGFLHTAKNAAPTDGSLSAGELKFWFDKTDGAAVVMFKGKTTDGTVVTGSVNLT